MKLKKIASLALAGIMAVSMLAGCKGQGTGTTDNGSSSEVTVSNTLAEKVVANLSSDVTKKVTFSTGNDRLNMALEIALEKNGSNSFTSFDPDSVLAVDASLGKYDYLPVMESTTSTAGSDCKTQKIIFVKTINAGSDQNAAYLLATEIEKQNVMVKTAASAWYTMSELPTRSNAKGSAGTADNFCWDFAYAADVAVTKVTNTTNNEATYVAAVVVTRTPTKNTNI